VTDPGEVILVVEDDRAVARVVSAALRARGFVAPTVDTGQEALARVADNPPAVVVLDLGLPDMDGIDVCRQIRTWSALPIIVLTAEGADDRKVRALEEGADDYVTKPFSMPELLARVGVALRHRRALGSQMDETVLDVGDLHIDLPRHEVSAGGHAVELTPKEFDFLVLLARHAGKVLTHQVILREIWGPRYVYETQYLRVYASQLRKKLNEDSNAPRLVTEPGVGYRLVDRSGDRDAF